jgi:3-deoxy-7-phosphoheptulonate synthase
MPVGFKNGTDGSITPAVNAIKSSGMPHRFLGIDNYGRASVVTTTGNPDCHLVLRGGAGGPNFDAASVAFASMSLEQGGLRARIMVDCSHGNAQGSHMRQVDVLESVASQVNAGDTRLIGVMIESNLVAGKQPFPAPLDQLVFGQSITDACVDFPTTCAMLRKLAASRKESSVHAW